MSGMKDFADHKHAKKAGYCAYFCAFLIGLFFTIFYGYFAFGAPGDEKLDGTGCWVLEG